MDIGLILGLLDMSLPNLTQNEVFKKYFEGISIEKIETNYYFENNQKGIDIVLNKDRVVTSIHLFNSKKEGYFTNDLPHNISFGLSQDLIRDILGTPNQYGGGGNDFFLGKVPFWDKYYFSSYSLHIQYNGQMQCDLVTIGTLKLEPYFLQTKN